MDGPKLTSKRSGSYSQTASGAQGLGIAYKGSAGSDDSHHSLHSSTTDMEMDDMRSDEEREDDEETGLTQSSHRKRRRRREVKQENGDLDGLAGGVLGRDNNSIRSMEQKLVDAGLLRNILINALLIGLWYSFSISISVYNKWMFSKDNLNFQFPLFTTSVHMVIQFILASSVLFFFPRFRPSFNSDEAQYTSLNDQDDIAADAEATKPPPPTTKQPLMTKYFYITRIAPCGAATALDIGLGNFSLRFITLTFFTMCKSSVLAFVLFFAFLFHLEKPTWRLCAIILLMTVGVIMMVAGEAAFNTAGFVLVMSASLCSGFRWSLTQILLLRNRATSNPFSASFFLTPVMFFALFLLALPVEGPNRVVQGIRDLAKSEGGFVSILILLFPGCLAFLMVSAEFALLKRTSVVTLSVCGIFKEVLTISAAGIIFGDELTPINVSGLFVTITSIAAYNWLKYSTMREDAAEEVRDVLEAESGNLTRKSFDHDHGHAERGSTDALMRESLNVATTIEDRQERRARAISNSPIKRPEDLE